MLLERLFDESLAQASYLVACETSREAIVVDPNRDVERYVRAAAARGLRITKVAETHIHADFVSGARELARRTQARLLLSGEGGRDWQYRYAATDGATLLHEGDIVRVGKVRLDVMHTPGHTPEHIVFVLRDTATSERPVGMLTGDFVFNGDVGRPDLLERAAHAAGTMERSARDLFASLVRLRHFPGYLQLWPGHGAGSACGKALGAMPSTTLGYERLTSWAFQLGEVEEFVRAVLAGQPEPPRYFAEMKRINRDGPPILGGRAPLVRLTLPEVERATAGGAWAIDLRPTAIHAAGAIPGTINIPLGGSLPTWVGSLVPFDRAVVLLVVGDDAEPAERAARLLSLIGYDRVTGWAGADAFEAWRASGRALETIGHVDAAALAKRSDATVLDVRAESEWNAGHLPQATHAYLGSLLDRVADLPRDTPIVTQCAGGTRSSIAASLLKANGFTDVANLTGGIGAWRKAGLPVESEED